MTVRVALPGFRTRIASGSIPVLRLYHEADPAKRPGTQAGDAWLAQASAAYPGGVDSARWQQEMRIRYGALGGTAAFPEWSRWLEDPACQIVQPAGYQPPPGARVYATYDHGWEHRAAFYLHAIEPEGRRVTFYEARRCHLPVAQMAKILRGQGAAVRDPCTGRLDRFAPHDWYGRWVWCRADPQIWQKDQAQSDGPNRATADLFRSYGIAMVPAEKGMDLTVLNWLMGTLWADRATPGWAITRDCPGLLWELPRLRYKPQSAMMALTHAPSEALVDKDNDAWDSCKFFHQAFPPTPTLPRPERQAGTFAWARQQALRARQGRPIQTFTIRREAIR